jgi:hypothetical protein
MSTERRREGRGFRHFDHLALGPRAERGDALVHRFDGRHAQPRVGAGGAFLQQERSRQRHDAIV